MILLRQDYGGQVGERLVRRSCTRRRMIGESEQLLLCFVKGESKNQGFGYLGLMLPITDY